MTPIPTLSILTPAVPSRLPRLAHLIASIERQSAGLPVEHLVLLDNKRRTVGEKRDALLRTARGLYVAFVDDDDAVAEDYVPAILAAAEERPDVITFWEETTVNGIVGHIHFQLGQPDEDFRPIEEGITRRNAWHVCAWRRVIAVQSSFPPTSWGEDRAFAIPLCHLPHLREVHIPRILRFYRHSSETTEAPFSP